MNILQTEWWCIGIPPEWWADRDDDIIVIGDTDDVGVIEISTLCKDSGNFDNAEIRRIALDNAETDCDWSDTRCGDFVGVYTTWLEEESAIREWYLADGNVLLFATYSCEPQQRGLDDAAVDEIMGTLSRLLPSED